MPLREQIYSAPSNKESFHFDLYPSVGPATGARIKGNPSNFIFIKNSTGGDTTGASVVLPIYRAKLLKVGPLEFRDLKVLAMDLSGMRKAIGDDIRVAIGYNVISQHDWYFDLKNLKWSSD